jgi:hypothetical protein
MQDESIKLCYDCGYPITDKNIVQCPICGSFDMDPRHCRPKKHSPRLAPSMPPPWNFVRFELGGTGLLSGNRGSGKTTLMLKLRPTRVLTSEQQPEKVGQMFYRVNPEDTPPPMISSVSSWDQLDEDLVGLTPEDTVVVDSISQLASSHQTPAMAKRCIQTVQRARARLWFVAQFTKAGDMFGPNELNHLVDVVSTIPDDYYGMRRLVTEKNRFGPLSAAYFDISDAGIIQPGFDFAYSIEGPAGNHSLQMYPITKGALYNGMLEMLVEAGIGPLDGLACCGIPCRSYRGGFATPPDVHMRRRFAEQHGLEWITPEQANEWLMDPERARNELTERLERKTRNGDETK